MNNQSMQVSKLVFEDMVEFCTLVATSGRVPFITGTHGIGKSQIVHEMGSVLSKERSTEYNVEIIYCSGLKEGELGGLPLTIDGVTTYAPYYKLKKILDLDKQGIPSILFLDEFNRADHEVFQEMIQFTLNNGINNVVLPESTILIAAGNPVDHNNKDYRVNVMDPAHMSRFVWVELAVQPEEWLGWAETSVEIYDPATKSYVVDTMIDKDVIEFIAAHPENLHVVGNNDLEPNPRSWEFVSDI